MTGYVAMPGSMGAWTGGSYAGGRCVLAGNPGPMTLDGTNTWLLDIDEESVVLVDPGPDDLDHLSAVRVALGDRWVRDIVLTHKLYPDMGGKEFRGQFDKLLEEIQKQLNRPSTRGVDDLDAEAQAEQVQKPAA